MQERIHACRYFSVFRERPFCLLGGEQLNAEDKGKSPSKIRCIPFLCAVRSARTPAEG